MVVEKYAKIGDKYTRLIEECSEVIKVCCKIQRFGEYACSPLDAEPIPNWKKLKDELEDVMRIIKEFEDDGSFSEPYPNPYFNEEDGHWYWYDEAQQESNPYDTKEEAEKDLVAYVKWLEDRYDEE